MKYLLLFFSMLMVLFMWIADVSFSKPTAESIAELMAAKPGWDGAVASSHAVATVTTTNGLSISGQEISISAASPTLHGVMTNDSQTIAGEKTLTGQVNFLDGTILKGINQLPLTTATGVGGFKALVGGFPLISFLGDTNTFLGYGAGNWTLSGLRNSFLSSGVGSACSTCSGNIGIGDRALYSIQTGSGNIAIGPDVLQNANGITNLIVMGTGAGGAITSAANSTIIGANASAINQTGRQTTYGASAMSNSTSTTAAAFGYAAGAYGGDNISAFGDSACNSANANGTNNTCIGKDSIQAPTVSVQDMAGVGRRSLYAATGSYGSCVGSSCGYNAPPNLACVGYQCGRDSGSLADGLVCMGRQCAYVAKNGPGGVFLGDKSGYNEQWGHRLYIEDTNAGSSAALIYGEFDNDILRINGKVGIKQYPNFLLHADGSGSTVAGIKFTQGDSISGTTATDGVDFAMATNGDAEIRQRENKDAVIYTNNTERMRVKNTGTIYMGNSTSPATSSSFDSAGFYTPVQSADSLAGTNTIYYSTDAGKLVYKDSIGTVNNLY